MKRWIPHSQNPRWPACSYDLRQQLGLPKKLTPRPKVSTLVGDVTDNTGQQVEVWDLPDRGFHRLHFRYGDRMIPSGRLHQTRITNDAG